MGKNIIDDRTVISNINAIMGSSSQKSGQNDQEGKKVGKPNDLVANWDCTCLYKKASWIGRFWQVIRWITHTEESSLRKTIAKTSLFVNPCIEKMEKLLTDVNKPGILGNYWKNRKIRDTREYIRESLENRRLLHEVGQLGINTLSGAFSWARRLKVEVINQLQITEAINRFASIETLENLVKAKEKTEEAVSFAKRFEELGFVRGKYYDRDDYCSIKVLYRELLTKYPKTDEELEERRDEIQRTTLGDNPKDSKGYLTDCPARLIYAPLIAIANKFVRKNISLMEIKLFINDFMEQSNTIEVSHNGQLLLDMIKYLRDPENTVLSNIPKTVLDGMKDSCWIKSCNAYRTRAQNIVHYEKVLVTENEKITLSPNYYDAPTYTTYIPRTVTKTIRYYYIFVKLTDGTEKIHFHGL